MCVCVCEEERVCVYGAHAWVRVWACVCVCVCVCACMLLKNCILMFFWVNLFLHLSFSRKFLWAGVKIFFIFSLSEHLWSPGAVNTHYIVWKVKVKKIKKYCLLRS